MSISAGRLVAGSCTACGNAMQCPFEAVPPCFNKCTCTVGATLAISICWASDLPDKISGTGTGSMLFPSDQISSAKSAHVYSRLALQSPFLADLTEIECVSRFRHLKCTNSTVYLISCWFDFVVDLLQLHATFSLALIFLFGLAAVFFSSHLFPLSQVLQTHNSNQLLLL